MACCFFNITPKLTLSLLRSPINSYSSFPLCISLFNSVNAFFYPLILLCSSTPASSVSPGLHSHLSVFSLSAHTSSLLLPWPSIPLQCSHLLALRLKCYWLRYMLQCYWATALPRCKTVHEADTHTPQHTRLLFSPFSLTFCIRLIFTLKLNTMDFILYHSSPWTPHLGIRWNIDPPCIAEDTCL